MDIPQIGINGIGIRSVGVRGVNVREIPQIYTPEWLKSAPTVLPNTPPVTQQIGVPIINMPGCVEAHEGNTEDLKIEDPKGIRVFCDAGMPNFNPIDYDKNKIEYEYKAPIPPVNPPTEPDLETPKTEIPKTPPPTNNNECPSEIQAAKEPVGTVTGDEKIVNYKLIKNGDAIECVPIKVKLSIPDQIVGNVPTAGAVVATASIAAIATTSALLAKPIADLLLKVVKPAVKKAIKKIATLRGKHLRRLSRQEQMTDSYRLKKGLPAVKRKG